jgi:hypothetical protein
MIVRNIPERRRVLFAGAVVFSQFSWPSALQQPTALLADGTSVPMATVHFAAMTGAPLTGR